jgi:uncharacterized protein YggE
MKSLWLAVFSITALQAQSPAARSVTASGNASVFAAPDQATIDVTVSTRGASAQEAASKNADQMNTLMTALEKLVGSNGDVKSTSYYISPNYNYPQGGGTPTIAGYTAASTVEVTLSNLSLAGPVIDTSAQNGATNIGGLSFGLHDPEPQRLQALKLATAQARAHAEAMANAVGRTLGAVSMLQEGSQVRIQPIMAGAPTAGAATTIQPGLIEIQATVTLTADLS